MPSLIELDDLYAAAALALHGHPYDLEKRGTRHRFVFAEDAADTLKRYFQGDLSLNAHSYADSIRALKGVIHLR